MNEAFQVIFGLLGGLSIFLFGMNMMSESLQKAAGEKMKKILGILTVNPIMGVLAGALATAVLQSSSATTVMIIGFVSAGLMTLKQGISVLLGANIGTTMTAQLLAFHISDYIYVIIFVGFFLSFLFKDEKIKNVGLTFFSFGLLFEGIEIMGGVMKPLAASPVFLSMIAHVSDIPVLGVAVGTLMTLVVQSSSATIAVLQNFASQAGPDGVSSIMGLAGAIPVLLGDNIGTTITALLACIGQSRDAKRTALAHCTFNVSGALLFIWFVKPYAYFIQMISTKGPEVEVIARQIANAHTIFNVTMTLIWLPLIWLMVKIVTKLVPDTTKIQNLPEDPVYLDFKMVGQPAAALEMVAREILRCGAMAGDVIGRLEQAVKKQDLKVILKVGEEGMVVRKLYDRILEFLASLFSSGVLTEEQATQTAGMMYVLGDMERTDALCMEAADALQNIAAKNHKLSEDAVKDLRSSLDTIGSMYDTALQAIQSEDGEGAEKVVRKKDKILDLTIKLRKNHMKRVKKGSCNVDMTRDFMQILHSIDRVGNSCADIAEASLTGVNFKTVLNHREGQAVPEAE